ncbi:conserved protein, unknown function [Plasmodium knowlesi strain H]|uniref:Uncharacterized protein n=2 Tax=Plasmodium knowlesi TaxID=5850 RepID=B3L3Z1_PLAKH|nr:conserved protein, unknown function [Plasmodium knowlesi strain H]OTN65855.1 Uncharacterized protein PKNOH_S100047900 [Plasmodium knowlesi]CAA9987841.1 conserved protein, unknown function [Plasmodium knowlesi strain H]VVS77315.1 conserved protein, unknown function [Plasmodium knowlesi strain H]|eukprot:XP_002258839.1 hypothetical protein, conserved in Plasmodium species [Plasmodium knowlesi strain H]
MFYRSSASIFACLCYALTLYIFPFNYVHGVSPRRQATNPFFLPTHFDGVFSPSRKVFRIRNANKKDCIVTVPNYTTPHGAQKKYIEEYYSGAERGKYSPLHTQKGDVAAGGGINEDVSLTGKKKLNEPNDGVMEYGPNAEGKTSPVNPQGDEPLNRRGETRIVKYEEREDVETPLKSSQGDAPTTKDANNDNCANGVTEALKQEEEEPVSFPLAQLQQKRKRKKVQNEEVRKKLSELAKLRWRDEEERKKLLRCKNQFKHSEKTKQLLSYKIKLKWTDENYRKSIIEKTRIFNQDENTKRRKSILLRQKWKTKEFRDKMLSGRKPFTLERRKRISEIIKQKWREDEYKQKTLQAIRDNYKKRKLQVGLNPNFNYVQNVMLFKRLGLSAPKIRFFPSNHREKLRGKKKRKKKKEAKDPENYKENWRNIYDSLLDTNEFQHSLAYMNHVGNLSVSTNT